MAEGSVRYRLILGFAVSLLLLIVLSVEALTSMVAIQSRLKSIVENHNVKTALINDMRNAARDRTISLYQMVTLDDPFEVDKQYLQFNHHAAVFAKAHEHFLAMDINNQERAILQEQAVLTGIAVALQEQVVDLVMNDRVTDAITLLTERTVPAQDHAFARLALLYQMQNQAAQAAQAEASAEYQDSRFWMVFLGVSAILIGLLVAMFINRNYARARAKLFREKERAQVTLRSIGEGVITTDKQGIVRYLNPVAEELTGWPEEEAKGKLLPEIMNLMDEAGSPMKENLVSEVLHKSRIVHFTEHDHLIHRDGNKYAVEVTAAPLQDYDQSTTGAVISFRNVTAMRDMARQMVYQATHDNLTGLVNRHEFERRLKAVLNTADIHKLEHVLCYIDLDQFKIVNDTCGHMIGDELLRQLAQLLRGKVRASDILSRLGGDEFGLLLLDCSLEDGCETAESLLKAIRDFRFVWHDKSFKVGASIGLVLITEESGSLSDVMSAADSACYVAKDFGRNRIHVYQIDDEALNLRHGEMQWTHRIRDALENNKFKLFYQSIICLADRKTTSRELLIRLQDDDGKIIPPMAFLPSAERYGLMPLLDRWVIERALDSMADERFWHQDETHWTINLSGHSLCDDKFLGFVMQGIKSSGVPPEKICFEITETAAVTNLSRASKLIKTLKALGCKFALDDFGSGLSSFTYLKNLPVDYLKIDGSFVKNLSSDPVNSAMVESINQIGHIMGLKTIAEFAEDKEAIIWLHAMNVDFAQGFVIHEPELLTIQDMVSLPAVAEA